MTRALTDLLAALDEQAKAELSDVEQGQRAKADRVCALARTEAERLRLSVVASAVSTAEYEAARLLADARLGAARTRRTACEQALTEVRAQVQERLAALGSTNAGTAATLALVDEALEQLPGASTVVVPANHADAVSEHLAGRTAAEVTGDERTGCGAVVADDAGRLVDNRSQTRLDNAWPRIRGCLVAGWQVIATEPGAPS